MDLALLTIIGVQGVVLAVASTIGIVNILNSTMRCPVSFYLLDMWKPPVLDKWSPLLATAPFHFNLLMRSMHGGNLILSPVSYL
jgi:hypothetical protein